MWVIRLKIRHDCTIGTRCQKFNCVCFSLPLSTWKKTGYYYITQRHTLGGNKEVVETFLKDLANDKRIVHLEISKNTVFFIERRKQREIPAAHYNPQMFFVQPVYVDKQGYEYWELASWKKEVLMTFMKGLQKVPKMEITLEKFHQVKLDSIYFPKILPRLSGKQLEAFELAVERGYYVFPRQANLGDLAKEMKVTVSTFQEHLRRAEAKIMPSYA